MDRKRIVYLDYLRIIACFAVVLLHVCGEYYNDYPAEAIQWRELNFLDGMTRWSVPVFVMISGAAVLGRNYSIEKIKKAILRFCIIYFFWSTVYGGVAFASGKRLKESFSIFILGDTHMWFIPMIAGLYILIPFLDNLVKDMRLTKYYLGLAFLIAIVAPTCASVLNCINPYFGELTKSFFSNMGVSFVTGYTGYFVLGKYLSVQNEST